jgi:prevent-host-death family protein
MARTKKKTASLTVNVHEARTHLSRLLSRAAAGEDIVIAKAGRPVARLVAIQPLPGSRRRPGRWEGRLSVPDSFFEPLPNDVLTAWEGRGD